MIISISINQHDLHPRLRPMRSPSLRSPPWTDLLQDLVIPVAKMPNHYSKSPYLGGVAGGVHHARDILVSFRGDLGLNREGCVYSRCGAVVMGGERLQQVYYRARGGQARRREGRGGGDRTSYR